MLAIGLAMSSQETFAATAVSQKKPASAQKNQVTTPGAAANQVNLENFVKKIRAKNKNNPNLPYIEEEIRKGAATSTNLVNQFLNEAKPLPMKNLKKKLPTKNPFISFLYSILVPQEAFAQEEEVLAFPFGGPILYAYPCTCSGTWLVFVGPTANLATSAFLLDYEMGTELYSSYNLPFAPWVLGEAEESVPICYMYAGYSCFPIYTEGVITPLVGSSPA